MKVKITCCNCDLKDLGLYPAIQKGDIIEVEEYDDKYYYLVYDDKCNYSTDLIKIPKQFTDEPKAKD